MKLKRRQNVDAPVMTSNDKADSQKNKKATE